MRWMAVLVVLVAALIWWRLNSPRPLTPEAFAARYGEALAPPGYPLRVYHLGHSLVGRDMPAMLAQLMGDGYAYASQLGWGASLKDHWKGDVPGFVEENSTAVFAPAREAIGSGLYDAVVLTEMVEIRDAIRYHDSGRVLADWAVLARAANPAVRVYLYETWHRLDDPEGWLHRLDLDLHRYWERALLRPAMGRNGVGTIHVIPAGQVMAAMVRRIEAGEVPGLSRREDLFARGADRVQDVIHLNDLGAYLVALTHYAVLTGQNPEGLPHALRRADGSAADAPSPEVARIMQQVVWRVVSGYAPSGVAPEGGR